MGKRKRKKLDGYSVLIAKVFPPDDPVAVDILRLMSVCNDVYFVEEWVNGHKSIPKDRNALTVASGRNALQVRLLYSFLYEGLKVMNELANQPQFLKLRPTLDDDAETAFARLLSIKLKDQWKNRNWGLSEAISRARNTATFHYDRERVREALQRWLDDHGSNEQSLVMFQKKSRPFGTWPYYSIADMARAEIAFGIRNPNHADNLKQAIELMKCLELFTDNLFLAYVKDRNLSEYVRRFDVS